MPLRYLRRRRQPNQLLRDANAWSVSAAFGAARRCVRLHSSGAAGRTSHTHIVTHHIAGKLACRRAAPEATKGFE